MVKFPNIKVQRVESVTFGRKKFQKALTIANIQAGFKRIGVRPFNLDALMEYMHHSDTFYFSV